MKNEKGYFKSYVIVDSDGYEYGDPIFFTDENHEVKDCYADSSVPNFYKPRWDFELREWVEGATDEEIEEITKPRPREPTEIEILKEENRVLKEASDINAMAIMNLADLILGGGE